MFKGLDWIDERKDRNSINILAQSLVKECSGTDVVIYYTNNSVVTRLPFTSVKSIVMYKNITYQSISDLGISKFDKI